MPPEATFSAPPARTLRDVLRDEGRLPFDRAGRILEQVGEALRRVHAGGLAYGVLEPGRVLVEPGSGRAWLAEAGSGDPQVKPAYLSPEQIDGRGPDMRSDIHALGLVGWEMLTGREPWEGESLYGMVVKQREHDLPRLTTLRPGIPRPLLLAIEGALHKHPYDRWATVDEFLAQLRSSRPVLPRAAEQTPAAPLPTPAAPSPPAPTAPTPPAPAPTARMTPPPSAIAPVTVARPRKRRWLAGSVLLLALLAAGAAALVAYQGRTESTQTAAWLDSLTTGAAAGEIVIDSGADSMAVVRRARAARLARERAHRDSIAAVRRAAVDSAAEAQASAARGAAAPDSVTEQRLPAIRPTPPWRPRPDSARRDTLVRRDTTPPDTTRRTPPDTTRTGR